MPFYLSTYEDHGSRRSFAHSIAVPVGSAPGFAAIDLRPNGGRTIAGDGLNACLLYLPDPRSDSRMMLVGLDEHDIIGTALRHAILARLRVPDDPTITTVGRLFEQLLVNPPANGWQPVRPTVGNPFVTDIWCGPLHRRVFVSTVGAELASDVFTDANGTTLPTHNANWAGQRVSGSDSTMTIQSNAAGMPGVLRGNHWTAINIADQYSQATVVIVPSANGSVRARCAAQGTQTYYAGGLNPNDFGAGDRIWKYVGGVLTNIAFVAASIAANDVIRLEAEGSSLTLKLNGVTRVGPSTDTAIASGRPGLGAEDVAIDVGILDNWSAGDLAAAAPSTIPASPLVGNLRW